VSRGGEHGGRWEEGRVDQLVARVRALWAEVGGAELPAAGVLVVCSPGSGICPPGWIGSVSVAGAVLVTTPTPDWTATVEAALAALDPARSGARPEGPGLAGPAFGPGGKAMAGPGDGAMAGPGDGAAALPGGEVAAGPGGGVVGAVDRVLGGLAAGGTLGPARLAYLDPADFAGGSVEEQVPPGELGELFDAAEPDEVDESGLDGIAAATVAVVREAGRIVAAAGWHPWPAGTAHVGVLTAAGARGRGLATRVAAAASADALAAGRLPQWRSRVPASTRVAGKLGYRTLGRQFSVHPAH
jgi:hypothetical protein